MPSILPGYEHDIFISYRQNDNQDGWVTHFVEDLEKELRSIFKEEISIYFDSNPHGGLYETHDVDASLKDKVRCLVFVPIVSQTYCDERSFAWRNELVPFLELATKDQFGLNIKLSGGNVAKRVLPVRIHDIDSADKALFESKIGGVLRPVDLIYREAGVNRPLRPTDIKHDNQENTDYANQLNKIAHSIKHLCLSMSGKVTTTSSFLSAERQKPDDLSVAVLPFTNISGDAEQDYFSDGISEEIVNALMQVPDLKIAGRTSSFSFKGKSEDLKTIGQKLNVSRIIEGSVRKAGDNVRINVQLVECETGYNLWSQKFDEELTDIFKIQDKIASSIIAKFKINKVEATTRSSGKQHTTDPELYNKYLEGNFYFKKRTQEGLAKALTIFEEIISRDSEFAPAYAGMADCYRFNIFGYGNIPREVGLAKLREASARALEIDPELDAVHASLGHTALLAEWDLDASRMHLERALELNPNSVEAKQWFGWLYIIEANFEKSIDYFNQVLAQEPLSAVLTTEAGWSHQYAGDLDEAIKYYERAIELDPSYALAHFDKGNAIINKGRYEEGIEIMEKGIALWPDSTVFLGAYGHFLARHGDEAAAREVLSKLKSQFDQGIAAAFYIADVCEGLGDVEETLKWLNIAYDNREMMMFGAWQWRKGHLCSDLLLDNKDFRELMLKVVKKEEFLR